MKTLMHPYCFFLIALLSSMSAKAQDAGVESVGTLKVSLIYGTDGDVAKAGENLKSPSQKELAALKKLKTIKFKNYRILGVDNQQILRSYENWAKPLKGSKEILLSFQPRGEVQGDSLRLDLEFWQSRKKVMKSGPLLKKGKPLFIQGPKWRGGTVIIAAEITSLKEESKKVSTSTK